MEEIAVVYARSLFEAALEQDKLDVVREQLGEFADALAADREMQVFFFSPYFSTQEKKDGLHRAIDGAEPIFLNFLELLLENHRMPALFRLRRVYDTLWERHNRLLPVAVTSAVELDEQTVRSIGDRIAEQTGRKIELSSTVEPAILGGIVVRVRIEGLDAGQADLTEVGTVLSVADGIARIHGLENCMSFEMLELPHDVTGLALNLESDNVGAVLFGPWGHVKEGDTVKRTNRLLEIPVGDALLGRIIDPLGRPLDGKGDITLEERRRAEFKAPGVVQRQPVKEPLQTGIKAIDAMIPIGRGQRELIIGDRQT